MKRIDLKRGDYFEVKSRVTGRIITVTGLCIDEDEILEYDLISDTEDNWQFKINKLY